MQASKFIVDLNINKLPDLNCETNNTKRFYGKTFSLHQYLYMIQRIKQTRKLLLYVNAVYI